MMRSQQSRTAQSAHNRSAHSRRPAETGYVLALSALLMIPLLAVVGFATDVGSWYAEGIRMQRAADAASLAGVVWLPDLPKATDVALDTARENGFDSNDPEISIVVESVGTQQLRVTISDDAADLYFSSLFLDNVLIERAAVAEYVLPVPLGSPKNYIGTAGMVGPPNGPEGFWMALNGFCAPKEQGDPFATRFSGNWPNTMICPSPLGPGPNSDPFTGDSYFEVNDDYLTMPQYEYIVELPEARGQDTIISIYDAAKHDSATASPDLGGNQPLTTTFTLREPDNTPFDDSDNPIYGGCTSDGANPRTFPYGESDFDFSFFGSNRWTRFCTIPANAPAGRWILQVHNQAMEEDAFSVNNYSIFATKGTSGTVCDTRNDPQCPAVFGKNWMSIYAQANAPEAEFYLAEIEPEHAGKQMIITLFDPGEGGNYVEVRDPNGNSVPFTYQTRDGDYSGGPTTQLNVSGCVGWPQLGPGRQSRCRFNERYVEIAVDLPEDYETLYPDDHWWKIYYDFNADVTDRTTWSVRIVGDPVRLVN
ncbi:MAG: hypothetical protein EDR02_02300 [Actinobacteria bacterium]|nr:MAG: hypothetical protein EDR02_02300 [Actinomycetota bacterium]RIK07543.1 MAG: hypothetical protein DCC48_03315 [Acidobacteriota bacterium]